MSAPTRHFFARAGKKDPELYVLLGVMTSAFGLAGWYLGGKPTTATSEEQVMVARKENPWDQKDDGRSMTEGFKYKYHPGGDPSRAPREAPSALYSVIVPNVTATKEQHERYNKWGKQGV